MSEPLRQNTAMIPTAQPDRAAQARSRTGAVAWSGWATVLLVMAILFLGAALRLTGVDWDEGQHLHPDERFLTMVTDRLGWPESPRQYLDTEANPLNPYNHDFGSYVYGLSPIVLAKFLGEVSGYTGYGGVYLAGRVMSAIADLLSVLLAFLIGRRLYGRAVGLLAALFLALSVLNIQQSHFFTVDAIMTLYVTLALYLTIRVAQGGGWWEVVILGAAFGLAVSAKISVLSFLGVIVLAFGQRVLVRWMRERVHPTRLLHGWYHQLGRFRLSVRLDADVAAGPLAASDRLLLRAVPAVLGVGVVLVVAAVVFRVVQPQAFMGPGFLDLQLNPRWQADMNMIQRLVSGEIDYPPSHQWTGRPAVWYMLENMVRWGLGLPLGIAVWATWGLMAYQMARRDRWEHLLPWAWMTFTFLYQSVQFVKTVRYLLPIYPTMAVMAAYGCVWLWRAARRRAEGAERLAIRRALPALAGLLVGVVVLGTLIWALAFTSIYTRPVTRVEASRWIYENVPPGTAISHEYWDDPIPLNIDGRIGSALYPGVRMDLYWEDVPEKREALYQWLEEVDIIALTSNRLYGSIPRLPMRYPMTTRYYEALFSGELGFEHYMTFTSRPSLLGIEIVDDDSDESFTVYDHPKVILFRKTEAYSLERAQALFEPYDLERVVRLMPIQADRAPNGLMFDDATWATQQAGGTWAAMFQRGSLANRAPTLVWLLAVYLLGFAVLPVGLVVFRGLRDRGYILSKTLGILLLGYLSWLLPSLRLAPYTRGLIVALVAALLVAGMALGWAQRRELRAFFRARARVVLWSEALFLVALLFFWLVRRGNPDLWHPVTGGEKPMDFAYLTAILRSTYFPPFDPWFAGGTMNYYYLGHVLVATLIKLTGIVPEVAYNLAIPTLFALTATGAFAVVYNLAPGWYRARSWLVRPSSVGLLGALLVAVAGNLGQVQLLWQGLKSLGDRGQVSIVPGLGSLQAAVAGAVRWLGGTPLPFRPEWWYWNASRVMGAGEINEFPFFTFLYADLHAHLIALPITLLALGLMVAMVRDRSPRPWWIPARLGRLGLLALTVGLLWGANTWDYPTYLLLGLGALAVAEYASRGRIDRAGLLALAAQAAILIVLSLALFGPYHAHYGAAYSSVEMWRGPRSSLAALLVIHGLPLFLVGSILLELAFGRRRRGSLSRTVRLYFLPRDRRARAQRLYTRLVRRQTILYDLAPFGLAALGAVMLWALVVSAWGVLLLMPVIVVGALTVLQSDVTPLERTLALLATAAAALVLGVEYVVLKGDIGRMNAVFKFYLQVWVLWGVVAAAGLPVLWRAQRRWWPTGRALWRAAFGVLLVGVMLYPLTATPGKVRDRWDPAPPTGLDGAAFMETARYHDQGRDLVLAEDLRAIRWLQENVEGSPVIAEANTPLYRWGGRVSVHTGLPSIVGWDWHQRQQRAAYSSVVVDWRLEDVRDLYNTLDIARTVEILARYQVGYVYVGELERAYYAPEGLLKFWAMVGEELEVAYHDGEVAIFRVVDLTPPESGTSAERLMGGWREWLARHWIPSRVGAEPLHPEGPSPIMLDQPVEELSTEGGRGWNDAVRGSAVLQIIVWWAVTALLGLAAWPLVATVARPLADAGYGLARGVGLLVVAYGVWLTASLRALPNAPVTAWAAVLVLGALGWLGLRGGREALSDVWQRRRRLIVGEEALFTLAFLAFVGLRLLNPDLWQPWFGGEKKMEIAFLNAITRSTHMPPYDPYYAGGTINYYYYGLFLVNVLGKLTGIAPEVAFNLAVPSLFGLTLSHAYVLGAHLGREGGARGRVWAGIWSALLVGGLGNLTTLTQTGEHLVQAGGGVHAAVLRAPGAALLEPAAASVAAAARGLVSILTGGATWPSLEYWYRGTRVIPYTINEFPFFSFLFADLHPHLIALPITILLLALGWVVLADARPRPGPLALRLAVIAIVLGALGPTNTWDLPAAAGLLALVALYRGARSGGGRGLAVAGAALLAVGLAASLLYAPFYAHFQAPSLGVGTLGAGERSPMGPFVTIWGTHLFLGGAALIGWLGVGTPWRRSRALPGPGGSTIGPLRAEGGLARVEWIPLMLGAAVALLLLLKGEVLLALLALLLAGAGIALWRGPGGDQLLQRALVAGGLAILLGVELYYLRDFLDGGDWRRMNTVFKFHMQAWVLLSLGLGSVLPQLWQRWSAPDGWGGTLWRSVAVALLAVGLAYPVWAIPQRVAQRFPEADAPCGTLDGTAYLSTGVYYWPDPDHPIVLAHDREAIAWLWEEVPGAPVIAEANLGYYREGGLRVSSFTGLPTIVGMHQNEQRPWDQVAARQRDVDRLYNTNDLDEALTIVARYGVRYLYVGTLERTVYRAEGLTKFDILAEAGALERAYVNAGVVIYRVTGEGADA